MANRKGKPKPVAAQSLQPTPESISGTFQAVPARIIDPSENRKYCPQHPYRHSHHKKQSQEHASNIGVESPKVQHKNQMLQNQKKSEKPENREKVQRDSKDVQHSSDPKPKVSSSEECESNHQTQEELAFRIKQEIEHKRHMEEQRLRAIEQQRQIEIKRLEEQERNQRNKQMTLELEKEKQKDRKGQRDNALVEGKDEINKQECQDGRDSEIKNPKPTEDTEEKYEDASDKAYKQDDTQFEVNNGATVKLGEKEGRSTTFESELKPTKYTERQETGNSARHTMTNKTKNTISYDKVSQTSERREERTMKSQTSSTTMRSGIHQTKSEEKYEESTLRTHNAPGKKIKDVSELTVKGKDGTQDLYTSDKEREKEAEKQTIQANQELQVKNQPKSNKLTSVKSPSPMMSTLNASEIDEWRKDKQQQY